MIGVRSTRTHKIEARDSVKERWTLAQQRRIRESFEIVEGLNLQILKS